MTDHNASVSLDSPRKARWAGALMLLAIVLAAAAGLLVALPDRMMIGLLLALVALALVIHGLIRMQNKVWAVIGSLSVVASAATMFVLTAAVQILDAIGL